MGKKRSKVQQHQEQSFGNLVSKAALAQLGPYIAKMVSQLGSELAAQQASTIEKIFIRLVSIEKLLVEKNIVTQEEMINKVADVEDEQARLIPADTVSLGDTVRLDMRLKQPGDEAYKNEKSKFTVENVGTGATFGPDVETAIVGMKKGDVKEVMAGEKKDVTVEITVNRISTRPAPPAQPEQAPAAPAPEGQDANQAQG